MYSWLAIFLSHRGEGAHSNLSNTKRSHRTVNTLDSSNHKSPSGSLNCRGTIVPWFHVSYEHLLETCGLVIEMPMEKLVVNVVSGTISN
jgi:hypothetical protein